VDDTKERLDDAMDTYHRRDYARQQDPVSYVWNVSGQANKEAVGLIAGCLAYGRVASFQKAIENVCDVLGKNPSETLCEEFDRVENSLSDFQYRWTDDEDILDLLYALRVVFIQYGTLELFYKTRDGSSHIEKAASFSRDLKKRRLSDTVERGLSFLLPNVKRSAAKRIHLFFRWMVRDDAIDEGIWSSVRPSELLIPLDTHVLQQSVALGLTDRSPSSNKHKTARDVTESLRDIDPNDPVKYDFALCHMGMNKEDS
jgi:uncharacterized protein (TIGR02757 family)